MRMQLYIIPILFLISACSTSPTGRSQLLLYPEDKLDAMGQQAFVQLKKDVPQSKDAKINSYVTCVADATLRGINSQTAQGWEVVVFEDDSANAFALPGKKIGVYTGMLKVANTQDQLAAVIGHEIAHVLAHHGNERASTNAATQLGLSVASASGVSADTQAILGMGAQYGILLPYSRTQESEADIMGLDIMARAGFDPRASVTLWQNMAKQNPNQPNEFLATHPSANTRMQDLSRDMPHALQLYDAARAQGMDPNCS